MAERIESGERKGLIRCSVGDFSGSEDGKKFDEDNKQAVSVVLAGCTKAGKSTLAAKLLGSLEEKQDMSAKPITRQHDTSEVTKNGVTLSVTDTIGLEEQGRRSVLRKLSKQLKHTERKADLLVYCLPVSPNTNFAPTNPAAMRSLQEAYGKGIWDHCIVALTFSNTVLDRLRRRYNNNTEEIVVKYKDHLLQHARLFQEELQRLGVRGKKMKLFAGYRMTPEGQVTIQGIDIPAKEGEKGGEAATTINPTDLVAIPAGDEPDDKVMLRFTARRLTIAAAIEAPHQNEGACHDVMEDRSALNNWRECLFNEMIRKCSGHDNRRHLLRYHYGQQILHSVTSTAKGVTGGGGGGLITGAAIGAGAGAVVGVVGGPVGVELGAILGAMLGGVTGVVWQEELGAGLSPLKSESPSLCRGLRRGKNSRAVKN